MRKNAIRLSITILTFCLGTAVTHLSRWTIETIYLSQTACPHSVLEGTTVRIQPYDATFEVPATWLTPESIPTPEKNLYLSRSELNQLYWDNGNDKEDAQVFDAVLPFRSCAAHFGDRGWGNYFWNDLQGRVYVVDLTPEEVATAVETRGLNKSLSVFEDAELFSEHYGAWQKRQLHVLDAPTHFMLMKSFDFYYRRCGDKTVVFVFLHAGGFEPAIEGILNSFKCR